MAAWFAQHASRWDRLYRRDDTLSRIYQRRLAVAMDWIDALPLRARARVLDLGCGAGHASVALARRGHFVVASDRVPAMLALTAGHARAAGVAERVSLVHGDSHALGLGGGEFDLVVALGVVPWLHSPAAGLREMARVLKPGGFLVASADNQRRVAHLFDPRLTPALAGARRRLRRWLGLPAREAGRPPHMHAPSEFLALLDEAGLALRAHSTCGFGPFTLFGYAFAPDWLARLVDARLQAVADRDERLLRGRGSHFLTLSSRR
ncbi:MAG: class I SAM-dependent methyltransferase [Chloroflexota bacterium]|nr:class I SAM-dependent methyltransferase [Chloroflexota bacterium]